MNRSRRRGTSLIEVLAVLTAMSVAMSVAAGLLHRGMRMQSDSRQYLERDRTALRLARQIREDASRATQVVCGGDMAESGEGDQLDSKTILRVARDDGSMVVYRTRRNGLVRLLTAADGRSSREDYPLAGRLLWSVAREQSVLTLDATPLAGAGETQGVPLELQVVAGIGTLLTNTSSEQGP